MRSIPRSVFYPVPNVDSVLLRLTRRPRPAVAPAERPEPRRLRALVAASFAHRRKTLAGSLRLAAGGDSPPGWERERVREALGSLGLAPDVRAERLSPEQFLDLARELER